MSTPWPWSMCAATLSSRPSSASRGSFQSRASEWTSCSSPVMWRAVSRRAWASPPWVTINVWTIARGMVPLEPSRRRGCASAEGCGTFRRPRPTPRQVYAALRQTAARALPGDVAVADLGVPAGLAQPAREALDDGDGAVPAAGAADRHREVAAVLGAVARQQVEQQIGEPRHQLVVIRLGVEVRDDPVVLAGERAQAGNEVRIGQEAHVEQQVRAGGDAVLEAEGDERELHLGAARPRREGVEDLAADLVHVPLAGVEDEIRHAAQLVEHRALALDRLVHRQLALGQRVRAPGLREAAHQRVLRGLEEEQRRAHAARVDGADRKSTRLNSSHLVISYAVFCLKK